MRAASLILLSSLALCSLSGAHSQSLAAEEEPGERPSLEEVLQRAQSLLLRSILRKMEGEESADETPAPQDWLEKRQHPGKREDEEEEGDEDYTELQKRQHPGKREDEADWVELQRRQHPGKRWMLEQMVETPGAHDALLSELLTKRQHPGRRLALFKRQHPGRREADAGEPSTGHLLEMDKRQHPGKRFWDVPTSDASPGGPCDPRAAPSCSKASLLLELLDNVSKSRAEEKRQHPGKRLTVEEDLTELE